MQHRHRDGRARVATGCAVLSLLVVVNPVVGVYFGAMGSIYAGACAFDRPASRRSRRIALISGLVSLLALAVGVILLATAPETSSGGE